MNPTITPSRANADAHLVARCRDGDLTAFDELMAQHQNRVFNLCLWLLRDHDAARDAAQDVFIRAFRGLKNFRGDCAFSTWLHRIAVNVANDAHQRRKRTPQPLSELETEDREAPEAVDHSDDPAAASARRERRVAVRRALLELSEPHRVVLVLFDIEGHAYEDICAILQLPMGTVKSRLNRARAALRDKLEPCRELFE